MSDKHVTRIYGEDVEHWAGMFETFVTITVGTDMNGHVRVTGTNAMTDDPPVVMELEVGEEDPHTTDERVSKVCRDVFMLTSLT
jgi:hypothetical protein